MSESFVRIEVVDETDCDVDFPVIHFDRTRIKRDATYRDNILSTVNAHARALIDRWCGKDVL